MKVHNNRGHLTYCSNIHAGESWEDTFSNLKTYTTQVRDRLEAEKFGIGLRLSNQASLELMKGDGLEAFKTWLEQENLYVFTINGFPYGGFHNQVVKDNVHKPDWTTTDRLDYTKRLFDILAFLLPEGMHGGVSTSPVSYRFWHKTTTALDEAKQIATTQLADLIVYLSDLQSATGKSLHLDMEPEPDGILETTAEFVDFFNNYLLKTGVARICDKKACGKDEAEKMVRTHFQLCYDVCHFAVGYEKPQESIDRIRAENIKIGRIQISAALGSGTIANEAHCKEVKDQLKRFDEPVYLHQAVMRKNDNQLDQYQDLGPALASLSYPGHKEIRTHFHVPVFMEAYEGLIATQQDIIETLAIWSEDNFTHHLEVETYTWDVLPDNMRTDIVSSVVRELKWVQETISKG